MYGILIIIVYSAFLLYTFLKIEARVLKGVKGENMEHFLSSEYTIKDGFENMDFEKVTGLLATAFWSEGIKEDEVRQGAQNSALVAGTFTESGNQVGYARVISDKTRFAYILDVFVAENHRKKGIGQGMIDFILAHPGLKDVYQWMLITRDAHKVYEKSGFRPLTRTDSWMEIRQERNR